MSFDLNDADLGNAKLEDKDYTGYTYKVFESGLYKVTINKCFGTVKPDSKTKWINFEFEVESTNEQGIKEQSIIKPSMWITNKEGKAYYISKKTGEHVFFTNYTLFNSIVFAATGKEIKELNKPVQEMVDVYDYEQKKEVPTEVSMFRELIGKTIALGLIKEVRNKTTKDAATGEYVPLADKETINEIDKVFTIKDGKVFTMTEIKAGVEEPSYFNQWLGRNKGVTRNKYQEIEGAEEQPKPTTNTQSLFG